MPCIASTRFGYAPRVMMLKAPFHSRNLSLAVALSAFAGCTIAPPQITLTSIRRADSTSSANEYELEFELVNTQGKAVELETWSYSVVAPDGSTYGGSWAALAVLPGDARKSLVVPAVLDATASTAPGASLTVSGELAYRDPGNFARLLREAGLLHSRSTFQGSAAIVDAPRVNPAAAVPSASPSIPPPQPAPPTPAG